MGKWCCLLGRAVKDEDEPETRNDAPPQKTGLAKRTQSTSPGNPPVPGTRTPKAAGIMGGWWAQLHALNQFVLLQLSLVC